MIAFPEKFKPLFEPHRYKVLYGGRGGMKSWNVARALLIQGAQRPLRVLCAREIQRTIADSVHRLLADQVAALELDGFYSVQDASISGENGSEFLFAGLRQQDVSKIKSLEGVDICWVEEAQTVTKKSWDVLIPTIRKEGSEIWMTFNPELDTDETYLRFVENPPLDSVVIKTTYLDNRWLPETLRKEAEDLKARDPEGYENVWLGNCRSAVEGAIYRREITDAIEQGRVRAVPYDPRYEVHTVWDLGWNDSMSIGIAQRIASEVRFIGHIRGDHRTLAEYVSDLKSLPYNWGYDWIPHDGESKDFKTGQSAQDILKSLGRRPRIVPRVGVEEGIKIARMVFPRCFFDEKQCGGLLHSLKRYRRVINQTTNEPGPPLHDEYSHDADMFRYMATSIDQWSAPAALADPYKHFRVRLHA